MVIAITGLKRSGKNTIADYLVEKHEFVNYSFAKPLKEVAKILFGWDDEHIENNKEIIDDEFGISPRQFLQWFGTDIMQHNISEKFSEYAKKIGRNIWVNSFKRFYEQNKDKNICISDFRFPHEKEFLDKIGATTIKVVRNKNEVLDLHESEAYVKNMECDIEIMNNGSREDLYKNVDAVMGGFLLIYFATK